MSSNTSTLFDGFCQNPECINGNNGLLIFETDCYHTIDHSVKPINIVHLGHLFKNQIKEVKTDQFVQKIQLKLETFIQKKCSQIQKVIRQHHFDFLKKKLRDKIKTGIVKDLQSMISKLKNGDGEILKKKLEYETSEKKTSFCNFLMFQIQNQEKLLEKEAEQIGGNLLHLIRAISNDYFKKVMEEKQRDNNRMEDETVNNSGSKVKLENQDKQRQMQTNNKNQVNVKKQHEIEKQFDQKKYVRKIKRKKMEVQKTKNINKDSLKRQKRQNIHPNKFVKPEKHLKINIKIKQERQKKLTTGKLLRNNQFTQQIQFNAEKNQIIIKSTNKPIKTFQYLLKICPNIKALHIFDDRFATRQIIIILLKQFEQLQTLTFNCNHDFDVTIADQLTEREINKIKHLQLKWAFDQFFNQKMNAKYFRQKEWKFCQITSKIAQLPKIYTQFKNSESLFIQSKQQLRQLFDNKQSFSKLKVIYAMTDKKKQMLVKDIAQINTLTQLTTLSFQQLTFTLQDGTFQKLIKQNKNLTTIQINKCLNLQQNLDDFFEVLSSLQHLKQFALKSNETQIQINPTSLFKLIHLQSLNIFSVKFKCFNQDQNDSICLRQIQNLKKLTHLGLYNCHPVYNDLFEYLQKSGTLSKLKFLCLGFTSINNSCKDYLSKMTSLEQLNLQQVDVSGETLADALQLMYLQTHKKSQLKYLSIDENQLIKQLSQSQEINSEELNFQNINWRNSLESMKKLSIYAPNLYFLNVENCNNLQNYDFSDFKMLKILGIDSYLNNVLPPLPKHIQKYVDSIK